MSSFWNLNLRLKHCLLCRIRCSSLSVRRVCTKAEAGEYIRVTCPHCVSFFISLSLPNQKLKRKKSNLRKILEEKSKLLNLVEAVYCYCMYLVVLICHFSRLLIRLVYLSVEAGAVPVSDLC